MTFTILARDPDTGAIGGAAATGSLCVGGWVLRGDLRAGMSGSQGASPSTLWGEEVLDAMRTGQSAAIAVAAVTAPDRGRSFRQLVALGLSGEGAEFTGKDNTPVMAGRGFDNGVAAGNLLRSEAVIDAVIDGYLGSGGSLPERLLASLRAGDAAGSDTRGLLSAALLVLSPDQAPLTLRIDYSRTPLDDLDALHARATSGDYARWCTQVPTLSDPQRALD
ncbi:MAG: DUF1028 domain-containing protein [Paracoccaceae bacterium]